MSKPYDVGYGKPPKHSRFKKGKSGNPAGRPKKRKSPINVLEEPVTMAVDGKKREVTAFEASLRKTAHSALEGRLPAIKRFFKYCEEADLLIDRNKPRTHGVYYVPIDPAHYPDREFNDAELAEIREINASVNKPPPEDPPTEKQAIIRRVAGEKHFIETAGRAMSIFELVQQKLRHRALIDRHEPSHAFFEKMLTQTTLDLETPNTGFLVVSAPRPLWLSPLEAIDEETGEPVRIPRPGDPDYERNRSFGMG